MRVRMTCLAALALSVLCAANAKADSEARSIIGWHRKTRKTTSASCVPKYVCRSSMARGIGSSSKASALVGLAILVGSLEVSSAATLVQTENFGPVPDGNASVRFFDLFDPSLGTLTSARYFLTSTIDDKLGVTVTTILSFLGSSVTAEFQLVHLPPTPLISAAL